MNPTASKAGEIVLKDIRGVTNGTDTTWGQQTSGTTPSLVNAMRVTFGGSAVTTTGDLAIGVLDPTAFNTGSEKVVGAFDLTGADGLALAAGPSVSIRYDRRGPARSVRPKATSWSISSSAGRGL